MKKIIIIGVSVVTFLGVVFLCILFYHPAPVYHFSAEEYGKWTPATRASLEQNQLLLPGEKDIPDILEYDADQFPEDMRPAMYCIACRIQPANGIEGWMNRCVQAGYQRMAKGDHVLFTTERTLDSVRELCNNDVLDGNMLCFSFVEFDEADQTILFVAAEFEDALDTPSSWFNHYLFTFINVSPDPVAIQPNM
ncbi:MAG: hypothetical protein IKH77_08830 [Clostridia bacterium]|nr:hypothetical protein [Clostridia bacterium]